MVPTIYIVRHGATAFNDPAAERLRGWNPTIELTSEGAKTVATTTHMLQGRPVHYIMSSDILRARQTADIIAQAFKLEPLSAFALRPLNLGRLTGELVEFARPALQFFQTHPSLSLPEGESYEIFFRRWKNALQEQMNFVGFHPEKAVILVTHSRNICAIPKILNSKVPFAELSTRSNVEPGQFKTLYMRDGKWQVLTQP